MLRVIAQRWREFLVTDAEDATAPDAIGWVVDLDGETVRGPAPVQSILKAGYWEEPGEVPPIVLNLYGKQVVEANERSSYTGDGPTTKGEEGSGE